jgi:GntR family histidine utilization transcriptional repressor
MLSRRLRKATRSDLERLPIASGSKVLAVTALHFASDLPFVLEERIISLETVPEAEVEHFVSAPPGTWLLEHMPWTQAEHTIYAEGAGDETATKFGIRVGTTRLVAERKTWQSGAPAAWVRLSYPGDRHRLIAKPTSQAKQNPPTKIAAMRAAAG